MKNLNNKYLFFLVPIALLFVVLLFVGGPSTESLRSIRYIWGMGHLMCFALWAYLYVGWRSEQRFFRQLCEVVILATILGGATELIQAGIGREAAWLDLGNDLIGGLIGVAFFAESRKKLPRWQLKLLQIPVLLLTFWSLLPVGKVMVDDVIAWHQFPLLSGFETSLERSRWSGSAKRIVDSGVSFKGNSSLRVELTTQRYSGTGLKNFPHNWDKYSAVSLQVFNPDPEPLTLHFRIHDQLHHEHNNAYSDRFNASFEITPGWNDLLVSLTRVKDAPKDRSLDLSRIAGMGVFVGKLARSRTIFLDDVKLLP